ncbi:MAG: hypothetical protein IJ650_04725 [Paludibacteraceae bacterium]|nr:hypothetical protein [Paludibacteraceae bacterium]
MKHFLRYLLAFVYACVFSVSAIATDIDWKNSMCLGWNSDDPLPCTNDPDDEYCIRPTGRWEVPVPYADLLEGVPDSWIAGRYLRKSAVHVSMKIINDSVLYIVIKPEEGYTKPWSIISHAGKSAAIISNHRYGGNMSRIKEVYYEIYGNNEITLSNSNSASENYGFWHSGAKVYMSFMSGASLKLTGSGGSDFIAVNADNELQISGQNYTFITNGSLVCDGRISIEGAKELKIQHSAYTAAIQAEGTLSIDQSNVNIVSTKTAISTGFGTTVKDSYLRVTGPAANGALRGRLTMNGCSITAPEGAAYNSSLFGVASGGALATTLTIEPDAYDIYIKGEKITHYSATHSSDYTYDDNTKTLTLHKDIVSNTQPAIVSLIDDLTIVSNKDSINIIGQTLGISVLSKKLKIYSKNSGAINIATYESGAVGLLNGYGIFSMPQNQPDIVLGTGRFYIQGHKSALIRVNLKTEGTTFLKLTGNSTYGVAQDLYSFNPYGLVVQASKPSGALDVILKDGQLCNRAGVMLESVTFGPKNYDLWIMGTQVTSLNCKHLETLPGITAGSVGEIYYDEQTNCLTISRVLYMTAQTGTYVIRSAIPDLTIDFAKNWCQITGYNGWSGIRLDKNTTITSDNEVIINCTNGGYGLYLYADAANYSDKDLTVTLKDINLKTTGMCGIGGMATNWQNHGAVLQLDNATITANTNGYKTATNPGASIGHLHDMTFVNGSCGITQPVLAYFSPDSGAVVEIPTIDTEQRVRSELKIEPKVFDVWVGGTQITGANLGQVTGSGITGSASLSSSGNVLTLKNFQYVGSEEGIKSELSSLLIKRTLSINVQGDNSIVSSKDGILSSDHVHIYGNGTLHVRVTGTDADALEMQSSRNLTIDEGVTVIFESTRGKAIKGYGSGTLKVDSAFVKATGATGSVAGWGTLSLQGGVAVISPAGAAYNSSLKGVALNGELVTSTVDLSTPVNYKLRLNGQYVNNQNCWNIANYISGITKVDASAESLLQYNDTTKTLTMQNVKLTTSDVTWNVFNQIPGLTIEVLDTCILYAPYCIALRTDAHLTIRGGNSTACLKVLNDGPLPRQIGSTAAGTAYAAFTTFSNANLTAENCAIEVAGAGGVKIQGSSYLILDNVHLTAQTVGTPTSDAQRAVMVSFYANQEPVLQNCSLIAPEGVVFSSTLHGYTTDNLALTTDKVEITTVPPVCTEGYLPGRFSVAAGKQVQFSQGNLQYQAGTNTWRFANAQTEYIGEGNTNISPTYDGWIDLFGWGTGNNPTLTSKFSEDYATFVDWGANPISNGCNGANMWRTLTNEEWNYLFYTRENAATLFGLGSVNSVNGLIILPDNWVLPSGISFTASTTQGLYDYGSYYFNNSGGNFSHNTYTSEQWVVMESAGAIFLPAAGNRYMTELFDASGSIGYYWSAQQSYENGIYYSLSFADKGFRPQYYQGGPYYGYSVRLVRDLENNCAGQITSEFTETACDSYTWQGETYTESGNYEKYFITANGCDSIVTLHLTIMKSVATEFSETACDSYTWQGETYTASGDYEKTFPMASGCDSIVTLHLTILKSVATEFSETACDSYTWLGETYTESGNYERHLTTSAGCDSLVTLHLTILNSTSAEVTELAEGSFSWNGKTYTESGNYTDTIANAASCDSVVTLHLTITEPQVIAGGTLTWRADDADIKDLGTISENTTVRGLTFVANASNTIVVDASNKTYDTLSFTHRIKLGGTMKADSRHLRFDVEGDTKVEIYCMSSSSSAVRVMNLAVDSLSNTVKQFEGINGSAINYCTYEYKGGPATLFIGSSNSGINIYAVSITGAWIPEEPQCEAVTKEFTETACDSYTWQGETYTASGDYKRHFTTPQGCDSTLVLHLTVLNSTSAELTETAEGSFFWNGTTYTESGNYTVTLTNAASCDSIVTLHLTITEPVVEQKWANGVLPGKFSVSAGKQVHFSQGNLQYKASTDTWQFAQQQTDYVGDDNVNISPTYDGWIDLFGWGTGNNPTLASTNKTDYAVFTDWGVNAISNGGNETNLWRTLTAAEILYLFTERPNAASLVALGKINNENGIILLPDDWVTPSGSTVYTMSPDDWGVSTDNFHRYYDNNNTQTKNNFNITQWAMLEEAGAVFLPYPGRRRYKDDEGVIRDYAGFGFYWTSTKYSNNYNYAVKLSGSFNSIIPNYNGLCTVEMGLPVRLVHEIESACTDKTSEFSASAETSYTWEGTTYTESGDYTKTLQTVAGCDSVVTLHLTITEPVVEQKWENGILPGKFSIAADKQIQFSQGNLQYKATADVWQFAETQFSVVGAGNAKISPTYDGWIDLFSWGTGNNPTLATSNDDDYTNFVDWGVNAISNGGNQPNMWRTPTREEWLYLLLDRDNASSLVGMGTVNGKEGGILLPDDWRLPEGITFFSVRDKHYQILSQSYQTSTNAFADNTYSVEEWTVMEANGAVFLPTPGQRLPQSGNISWTGTKEGRYWTSDSFSSTYPNGFYNQVTLREIGVWPSPERCLGEAVRLVKDVVADTPQPVEYEVAYVCDFSTQATKHNAYGDSWVYDNSWTVYGGSNYNAAWTYCKMGGKNTTLAGCNPVYIAAVAPFSKDIRQVKVYINKGPIEGLMTINEWGVDTYSNGSFLPDSRLSVVAGGKITGTDTITIAVDEAAAAAWDAGAYFRVYWDLTNTSSTNGIIWVDKIEFLAEKNGQGTAAENIVIIPKARKIIRDNHVIILLPDGTEYNVLGEKLK